jgi:hypothetical protein
MNRNQARKDTPPPPGGVVTFSDIWRRWGAHIERWSGRSRLSSGSRDGTYRRLLSPMERMWIAGEGRGSVTIAMVLEGELEGGRFDVERFRRAAEAASRANPAARVALRGALQRTAWVDTGRPVPVRVHDVGAWDGLGGEGADCVSAPFDPWRGPVCDVLLLQGKTPRVVVRAHHAAMDGIGLNTFAEDLFRALRGEPLIGTHESIVDVDLARELGRGKFGGFPRPGLSLTGRSTPGLHGARWVRRRIETRSSRFVPQVCAALTSEALRERSGELTFTIAVDMRGRRPGLRTLGNLLGVVELVFAQPLDARSVYREMLTRFKDRGEGGYVQDMALVRHFPLAFLRYNMNRDVARARATDQPIPSCGISYIEADLQRLTGGGFTPHTAFGLPPIVDFMGCVVDAVASGAGTDILVAMPRALGDQGRLEKILDVVCSAITGAD